MDSGFLYKPRHYSEVELWRNVKAEEWDDPGRQMRNTIRSVDQLKRVIRLNRHQQHEIERTIATLRSQGKEPMRITPYYATLMQADPFHPSMLPGEKAKQRLDPIFWQAVPTPANLLFPNTAVEGAMCEGSRSFGAAYQRYPSRVALFVGENTSCASYCVHCQRAKSLDGTVEVNRREIDRGLFYIAYNKNIDEVLVTGGDALMISRGRLQYILEELSRIPHLRVIRIATRVPVVLPMAVKDDLLDLIASSGNRHSQGSEKYIYFMTHINHYHEITDTLRRAVRKIQDHGFAIRNQTVLLNHVNDYYKTLAETFRRMLWVGVHPYYLLQCHKERGLVHLIAPIQVGKLYMMQLQGWLSGITVPKYAANVEGGGGKIMLLPSGHDTMNVGRSIDKTISESFATVSTWDGKEFYRYEALGRATQEEYDEALQLMDAFIGRKGVFLPKVIIVDEEGNHIETTNRTKLPNIANVRKAELLGYLVNESGSPVTNPHEIREELERRFVNSRYQTTG